MPEYRLSPASEQDMVNIWRYTRRQWGMAQANTYALNLKSAFAALAEAPQLAQGCAHIRPGYRRRSVGHSISKRPATALPLFASYMSGWMRCGICEAVYRMMKIGPVAKGWRC